MVQICKSIQTSDLVWFLFFSFVYVRMLLKLLGLILKNGFFKICLFGNKGFIFVPKRPCLFPFNNQPNGKHVCWFALRIYERVFRLYKR